MDVVPAARAPFRMTVWRRILLVGVLVVGIVGGGATAVRAHGPEDTTITVCCIRGNPIEIDIHGVRLTPVQIGDLVKQVTDFLLAKEAALTAELITVVRALGDLLQFVIIPFLNKIVDVLITVKENVSGKCVTTDTRLGDVCLLVPPA